MKKLVIYVLRPASFDAAFIRPIYFSAFLTLCFSACNSEKRVLKDPEKTARVVGKYLQTHQFDSDTITRYIEGDTVVQLLIGYDTTFIPGDTITKEVTRTVYKTVNKTDTVVRSITNNDLLKACQTQLMTADYDRKQAVIDKQTAEVSAKQWKMYFMILAAAVAAFVGLFVFFRK